MASQKTIPRRDQDFNVWQATITETAIANAETWLLDSKWIEEILIPAREEWNRAWAEYEVPANRTIIFTANKRSARTEYEKALMILAANLRINTKVTDTDRISIGIHIRDKTYTRVSVPSTCPALTVDSSIPQRLTVSFRDSESNSQAKPKGVHGIEIKWLISDTKPLIKELTNTTFDTRTPHTLIFSDEQRAKTVWICSRWENTRGEKGPWGTIVNAIIT